MSNQPAFLRSISFLGIAMSLLTVLPGSAPPAAAQDCQAALGGSVEAVALATGGTTSKSKGVDEWNGDILKIHTALPGVLVIEGTGDGAQNSVYTEGSSSFHPLVDSEFLGTGLGGLEVIVPAGDHCIQVAPAPGTTGDFEVEASFTDACHLEGADDHGDSFLCATPIDVDDTDSGAIGGESDDDMFTFLLTAGAEIAIESSGSTDVKGRLYDSNGVLLQENDNGGSSPNFLIDRSLDPGRYYIQIEGVNDDGSYGLSVSPAP